MPARFIELELPWPPSANHYYRRSATGVYISKQGKAYRKAIRNLVRELGVETVRGRCSMSLDAFPPDHRKRDIDNIQKPLLDSLEKAGVFKDDNQIEDLQTTRHRPVDGGMVICTICQT